MTPECTIDDFAKIDIRVGRVEGCERVPKSKKLLKLDVNFGHILGKRTILAGLGAGKDDDDIDMLIGMHLLFIVNLPPREMMGIVSHGMCLAADANNGGGIIAPYVDSQWLGAGARLR